MSRYNKFLVTIGGVVAAVAEAIADGEVSAAEWGLIGTAVAVAIGVRQVANQP